MKLKNLILIILNVKIECKIYKKWLLDVREYVIFAKENVSLILTMKMKMIIIAIQLDIGIKYFLEITSKMNKMKQDILI